MFPGVFYALLAGFLGAVASSSAKLSLGADYLKGVCETGLRTWGEQRKFRQADETTACDRVRHREAVKVALIINTVWTPVNNAARGVRACERGDFSRSKTGGDPRPPPLSSPTPSASAPSAASHGGARAAAALSCRVRVPSDIAARARASLC